MSNISLYCGSNVKTIAEVMKSPTPEGERVDGKRPFIPIPHGDLVSLVKSELSSIGLKVVEETYALRQFADIQDAEMFALLRIEDPNSDFATVVGLRNSHSKTLSAGLVIGSYVFVCDNLCFSGEVKIGRKHTKNILDELPLLVRTAIAEVVGLRAWQEDRYVAYKTTKLSDDAAIRLLTDLSMEHEVLPWSSVKSAIEEWYSPSFEEHAADGNSVWRLMQAVTECLKPKDLRARNHGRGRNKNAVVWDNPAATLILHKVLDDMCKVSRFEPLVDDGEQEEDFEAI